MPNRDTCVDKSSNELYDFSYLGGAFLLSPHAFRLSLLFGLLHSLDLGEFSCLSRGFPLSPRCSLGIYPSLLLVGFGESSHTSCIMKGSS